MSTPGYANPGFPRRLLLHPPYMRLERINPLAQLLLHRMYVVCDSHGRGPADPDSLRSFAHLTALDPEPLLELLVAGKLVVRYRVGDDWVWELDRYDADQGSRRLSTRPAGVYPGRDGVTPDSPRSAAAQAARTQVKPQPVADLPPPHTGVMPLAEVMDEQAKAPTGFPSPEHEAAAQAWLRRFQLRNPMDGSGVDLRTLARECAAGPGEFIEACGRHIEDERGWRGGPAALKWLRSGMGFVVDGRAQALKAPPKTNGKNAELPADGRAFSTRMLNRNDEALSMAPRLPGEPGYKVSAKLLLLYLESPKGDWYVESQIKDIWWRDEDGKGGEDHSGLIERPDLRQHFEDEVVPAYVRTWLPSAVDMSRVKIHPSHNLNGKP